MMMILISLVILFIMKMQISYDDYYNNCYDDYDNNCYDNYVNNYYDNCNCDDSDEACDAIYNKDDHQIPSALSSSR